MSKGNSELKDRPGRGGEDTRSRAEQPIGSGRKGKEHTVVQPSGSDDGGDLAQRGMTSEAGREHWKRTGLKVPKNVHENHHGGKRR